MLAHTIRTLITDLRLMHDEERFPKAFSELPKIKNCFKKFEETQHTPQDEETLFNDLVKCCKRLLKNSSLKNNKQLYLLVRSIAQYDAAKDANNPVNTLNELLIAQQKRDAIRFFEKERDRYTAKNLLDEDLDPAREAKYRAYQLLIDAINQSNNSTKLSDMLKLDSSVMKSVVTNEISGMPYLNIQETLSYNRGDHYAEPTSFKNFKKFCKQLIDPDTVLDLMPQEQRYERDALQKKLSLENAKGPKDKKDKIWPRKTKTTNKWYLPDESKHFAGEKRIYVIDMGSPERGRKTTQVGYMIGVWKIDRDNNWRYESKPNKFVAKIKNGGAEELRALIREAEFSEERALTKFKDVIIEGEFALARTALAEGMTLSDIILLQNPIELEKAIDQAQLAFNVSQNEEERARNAQTLAKLQAITPLTDEQLVKLCAAICRALQDQMHNHEVVHFDIKPENIMVDLSNPDDPQVKFIDFEFSEELNNPTEPGGTLDYAHPALRSKGLNWSATYDKDIYSLIITLLEVLTRARITAVWESRKHLEKNKPDGFSQVMANALQAAMIVDSTDPLVSKINEYVDALCAMGQTHHQLGKLDGLITILRSKLKDAIGDRGLVNLGDLIGTLDHKRLALNVQDKPIFAKIFKNVNETRSILQKNRVAPATRLDYYSIRAQIETSLKSIEEDSSVVSEYLQMLNIKALKDWCAKQPANSITRQGVLDEIGRIISDYEFYQNVLTNFPENYDKRAIEKIRGRNEKYQNKIDNYGITLDGMEALNKSNAELIEPPQFIKHIPLNDPSIESLSRGKQEANERIPINDVIQTEIDELASKNPSSNKKYTYEWDLIQRAITQRNTHSFDSLAKLLVCQQKFDVINQCQTVIQACEFSLQKHNNNQYMWDKMYAYMDLRDAMKNALADHTISVSEILARERRAAKGYIKFFETKINNHGFFHGFFSLGRDSGDFFEDIRRLPKPAELIDNLKVSPKDHAHAVSFALQNKTDDE